jgi:hypothetical protein
MNPEDIMTIINELYNFISNSKNAQNFIFFAVKII